MRKFQLTLLLFLFFGFPAHASQWVDADHLRARLIPGVESVGEDTHIDVALEIELGEGWHTYWRVPGDSGLPPRFDWSESVNVAAVNILWPAPMRKNEKGFYTFAYEEHVTFPLSITLDSPNTPTTLALTAQIMVCKDICIPQDIALSIDIPAGAGDDSSLAPVVEKARDFVPVTEGIDTLAIDNIVASEDALILTLEAPNGTDNLEVFPVIEEDMMALTAPPEFLVNETQNSDAVMVRISTDLQIESLVKALQGKTLSVTVRRGDHSVEKSVHY